MNDILAVILTVVIVLILMTLPWYLFVNLTDEELRELTNYLMGRSK